MKTLSTIYYPENEKKDNSYEQTETAILGGGCFWCTKAVFNHTRGVASVTPGMPVGPGKIQHTKKFVPVKQDMQK
jgi:peptide methionine sulfoxide reductase MsrA